MEPAPQSLFSAGEALQQAWEKVRQNLKPLLIIGGISAFLALLNSASNGSNGRGIDLVNLVVQLFQVAVTMAFIRAALDIADGREVAVPKLRDLGPDYLFFLLTSLLVGLVVGLGLVLLIVPGVIAAITFAFTGFLVMDQKLDPIAAMKESARLTRGVKAELFGMGVVLVLLNLAGVIALGVGLLLTVPMSFIVTARVYRRLQARAGSPARPRPQAPISGPPVGAH